MPPIRVDHCILSPKTIAEIPMALVGTTYMNEDAFSDPSFIVVKKKIVVPNPNDPTEIMRKLIQ